MGKKKIVLLLSALILLGGYTAAAWARIEGDLSQRQVEDPNSEKNREDIAKSVLESTGRTGQYDLSDLEDVTVYFGGAVTGNEEDVLVSLSFGPKNTVIAAYTPDGNVYEYAGDLGNFYGVRNIRFVPSPELGKDIVIVRENVDQSLGSFEQTDVLRGYVYENNGFRDVLNTPEKIESSWNNIWNQSDIREESLWRRVTENTESSWSSGENPQLTITRYQDYLESSDQSEGQVPEDETFDKKQSRVVVERFYWSEEWGRFILREAVEKATGEKVAIVEDLSASPYLLAGLADDKDYGILRKDGTLDYVKEEELEF
ncbi:hypothetical protein H9X85_00440 [Anaerotignum lactatifermentans]|uniref:Uncharacterized protein n=1 Tax=Anaerotignum lactatifermentans TaxID=160404 RepID=A0ABS2G6J3_9FIRM|nr:hypothetical protein [Anaerotignum lactatifermentans]MBM6828095.1 hypothetical protein [Anaerotignum lactatifermentans]MBM6876742.1 hypothetical protein [Anaerotignum lactatifermentans]MBM6949678.1 hypothetical protein [Anaerotignum lactatifermentans]